MEGGVPIIGNPKTIEIETANEIGTVALKSITPSGSYGGDINVKKETTVGSPPSTGGSKASKAENKDKIKKDDIVDRYMEVNDALDNTQKALEKANAEADKFFGTERVEKLEDAIEKYE
jgi:anti-sigma28 factor (negative regulator of flagellin synthesis)